MAFSSSGNDSLKVQQLKAVEISGQEAELVLGQGGPALSYSGQLDLYQQVVSAEYPDQPAAECWIHLVSSDVAARVLGYQDLTDRGGGGTAGLNLLVLGCHSAYPPTEGTTI